jgi:hypothetical protein
MNNRPIASLTPTLLARKGGARPAMRPQLQPLRQFQESAARQLDDLGWNDMGHDNEAPQAEEAVVGQQGAEIVQLNPAVEIQPGIVPEVVHQQEAIADQVSASRRSALADGRRAAFTLRLDGERHLNLRLACVTTGRSAQQIVTEALDRLIADLPKVAELAAKVRKHR